MCDKRRIREHDRMKEDEEREGGERKRKGMKEGKEWDVKKGVKMKGEREEKEGVTRYWFQKGGRKKKVLFNSYKSVKLLLL